MGDRKRADLKAHILICKQLIRHQGGVIEDFIEQKADVSALSTFMQQARDLKRQITHFADMIANPSNYFNPNPTLALFMNQETWVAATAGLMNNKVQQLKLLIEEASKEHCDISSVFSEQEPISDNSVQTVVVSPLASSKGEDHVASNEVCDPVGAYTVEKSGNKHIPQTVLRPTENAQISLWDRTSTSAWRGT